MYSSAKSFVSSSRSLGGNSFEPYPGEEIPKDYPTKSQLQPEWKKSDDFRVRPMYRTKYPWEQDLDDFDPAKYSNDGEPIIPIISNIYDAIAPSVGKFVSDAKDVASNLLDKGSDLVSDIFGSNTASSSFGASAKPVIYSDWSPASKLFGMDQGTAYSEHMVNTAHQREVADLKAAGLNPVLGISGSGSSSVSGNVIASSSAEKAQEFPWMDVLGATAGLITTIVSKKPALGFMVSNVFKSFDK